MTAPNGTYTLASGMLRHADADMRLSVEADRIPADAEERRAVIVWLRDLADDMEAVAAEAVQS